MSDPINPSTVQLIDIEHLLDDSESDAREKLLKDGFDPRVIDVCVTGKPYGRYMGYVEDQHSLLFDYEFRYDIAILQHVQNLRVWLAKKEIPADEWLSHGYALAWMHHHSAGPDRRSGLAKALVLAQQDWREQSGDKTSGCFHASRLAADIRHRIE